MAVRSFDPRVNFAWRGNCFAGDDFTAALDDDEVSISIDGHCPNDSGRRQVGKLCCWPFALRDDHKLFRLGHSSPC
ncbi:hypothetical protein B5V02_39280 [Mesorhizobium kowhaii]|uniref:Uncharacterized protein n=1 Tax=Mesorhizobium kowhaii TaxID=1300272 RepID=A0A2W7BRY2_9HYPH|nr:hypothetical protein B5V02_39280 [Mesorhizobium kowhaii]